MARVLHQDSALHAAFDAQIKEKEERGRQAHRARIDESMPHWLAAVVGPLAQAARQRQQHGYQVQGRRGENQLTLALRWRLDQQWALCPDVVIQTDALSVAQLDLLVLGPSTIFILEVKTWTGAVRAGGARWERKTGSKWSRVESPVRQQAMHTQRFRSWIETSGWDGELPPLSAAIVILNAQWLRTRDTPYPVFDRPSTVARWMKTEDAAHTPLAASARAQLLQRLVGCPLP